MMRKLFKHAVCSLPVLMFCVPSATAGQKETAHVAAEDTVETVAVFDAGRVFAELPASVLDLLSVSERLDMLAYNDIDSIAEIKNLMDGFSHLVPPVTDNWLKVQVTPVTTLTVKILPYGGKELAATAYTIGDSLKAADTDLSFFDGELNEIPRNKFLKLLTTEDFFDFKGVDSRTRKELLDLVPFPTVEYSFDPNSDRLHARLTSGEFLGRETLDKIEPYLRRDRWFEWTGRKFRLMK